MPEEERVLHGPRVEYAEPVAPLGQYLLERLREHGGKAAQEYIDLGCRFTFSDLERLGCSVATELRRRGVRPGDVVVVCCRVRHEFSPILLGALFTGAVLAPLNPANDQNDFKLLLDILQPRIVISISEAAGKIESALPALATTPELVVLDDEDSWLPFTSHELRTDFKTSPIPDFRDKPAVIMCSSGTSGLPKGVTVTHGSIFSQMTLFRGGEDIFYEDDVVFIQSSPFWISGVLFYVVGIDLGNKIITGGQFEENLFLKTIQDHKVTFTFLPPNQAVSLAKSQAAGLHDLSSLRYIMCGGASMSKETQAMVENTLNVKLHQGYGMTEIMVAVRYTAESESRVGSSGSIVPNMACKVLDVETSEALGPCREGELCFKGFTVTKGYYRNPEATAAAIDENGWFHTGDIGYYDEEGFFYIVDRLKDLIKYKGNHVAPVEVESVLLEHPGVKDAAVVGVKHELDQERPLAVVVRQPGSSVTERELVQLVQDNLAEHKWLRAGVQFMDDLPKTPTGKVQRRVVRNMVNS